MRGNKSAKLTIKNYDGLYAVKIIGLRIMYAGLVCKEGGVITIYSSPIALRGHFKKVPENENNKISWRN